MAIAACLDDMTPSHHSYHWRLIDWTLCKCSRVDASCEHRRDNKGKYKSRKNAHYLPSLVYSLLFFRESILLSEAYVLHYRMRQSDLYGLQRFPFRRCLDLTAGLAIS
jgi:hypothetical protein